MADQVQAESPPAETKTVGQSSRDARDATFKARAAKAAKRFASAHGAEAEQDPKGAPAPAETAKDGSGQQEPAATPASDAAADEKPGDVDKRHAIAERRERRVKQREEKAADRERKLSTAEHNLQSRFGDPVAIVDAYNKGEFHQVAKAIQRWIGDDFATITQKIARATAGLSPEKLKELEERDAFTREKREFEAAKRKEAEEKTKGATREKARATVAEKCKGHDALKLKNGAELILQELERGWDAEAGAFKVTFKQAADRVLAEKLAEAEALGLRRPQAMVKTEEKPAPAAKPKATPPPAAPQSKNGRVPFEERHAAAGRVLARRRSQ